MKNRKVFVVVDSEGDDRELLVRRNELAYLSSRAEYAEMQNEIVALSTHIAAA